MASGSELLITPQQHSDLSSITQSRALPAGYVFRARLILMLAQGASFNAIKRQLQTTAPTIVRWKQRFREYGLEGLDTYHPGQKYLCPPRQQIHIILDNLSAHKTQAVREFLQQHPRFQFHFTPTYSSWLNQVEIWFAKIEREVIARGIFT